MLGTCQTCSFPLYFHPRNLALIDKNSIMSYGRITQFRDGMPKSKIKQREVLMSKLCEGESNSLQVLLLTKKRSFYFGLCMWMFNNTEKKIHVRERTEALSHQA